MKDLLGRIGIFNLGTVLYGEKKKGYILFLFSCGKLANPLSKQTSTDDSSLRTT